MPAPKLHTVAKYFGTCPECGMSWHIGDPIAAVKPSPSEERRGMKPQWTHEVCPEPADDLTLKPNEKVCPQCWLVHPEGACDR